MRKLIAASITGFILSTSAMANNQEIQKMNNDEAILTRQLNAIERIAESHGRFVVLRDKHLLGKQGIIKLGKTVNERVDVWSKKWMEILRPLATQGWTDTLESPVMQQKIDAQAADLESIAQVHAQWIAAIRGGARLAEKLPTHDVTEFQKAKLKGNPQVVFLDAYGQHVALLNSQFDYIRTTFQESEKALSVDLIAHLRNFSNRITDSLKLITAKKKLSFPELAAELQFLEKMLGTMEALMPIQGQLTHAYEQGQSLVTSNNLLESEAIVKKLETRIVSDFVPFENKPQYDQERVRQSKALARMQLNDLKNQLGNKVSAHGGRAQMLATFIKDQSRQGPLPACRGTGSERIQYDCSLFRAQVVPLLPRLTSLQEPLLEQLAKILKQVYQGPVADEERP